MGLDLIHFQDTYREGSQFLTNPIYFSHEEAFNVPANTCHASSDLAVRLRNIYPYSPQT